MTTQPDSGSDLVETVMEVSRTFTLILVASMTKTDATITTPNFGS